MENEEAESTPRDEVVERQQSLAAGTYDAEMIRYADREVLNVDEVAEVLRIEERLVYDSIKRDQIPGVRRFGKRGIIRVSRRVFFDWLHGRTS
jgi:hypothetical protein